MQLMPATAKWVAGKIGMTDFTPASVNDFDTNTELGTNYLNMVLRDLDGSQMLASAGYNAARGGRWRSTFTHPVEGAIFAETIPFNETRTYVKNVMSNSVYYAAMFGGQPQSLKERLGRSCPWAPKAPRCHDAGPATQGLQVYIVGGAVRDACCLPAGDQDWVVVGATPEDMARRGFMPVGGDFPVFLHPKEEYALARTERKSGHKGFTFHTGVDVTLEDDLRRRDRAIARKPDGELVDPLGDRRARVFPTWARPSRKTPCASCGWAASRRASPISASRPRRWRCAAAWSRPAGRRAGGRARVEGTVARPHDRQAVAHAGRVAPVRRAGAGDAGIAGAGGRGRGRAATLGLPLASRYALMCRLTPEREALGRRLRVPTECNDCARLLPEMLSGLEAVDRQDGANAQLALIERADGRGRGPPPLGLPLASRIAAPADAERHRPGPASACAHRMQ